MHISKHIAYGSLMAVSSAVISGLGTPIAKTLLMHGTSPLSLTVLRLTGTALVFWTASQYIPHQTVSIRHLVRLMLVGMLGIAPQLLLFNYGLYLSFPIEVSIISSCSALWVVILGTITRRIARARYLKHGTWLTTIGMMITIFFFGEENHNLSHISGNGIVMVSMLVGGVCTVATAKLPSHYHTTTIYKWLYTFAIIPLIIYTILSGRTHLVLPSAGGVAEIAELIYVCIIMGATSIVLHSMAEKRISTKTNNIYGFAQPFVSIIVAYNIGYNTLTWFDPLAIIMIFVSYLIATQKK